MYLLFWKLPVYICGKAKINNLKGRNFRIAVAGVAYKNDDRTSRQKIVKKCKAGEELMLVRSPSKYDEYGIQICRRNGSCIGWVPERYSYEFTSEMERGRVIKAYFYGLLKPDKHYDFYGGRVTIVKE